MSDGNQFNFRAWVEQTSGNGGKGKLHVHGEVKVKDEKLLYQLGKRDSQGYFEDELFLEIKPDPTPGNNTLEIKYHEDVDGPEKYRKVTIFANNEQVFEINNIGPAPGK